MLNLLRASSAAFSRSVTVGWTIYSSEVVAGSQASSVANFVNAGVKRAAASKRAILPLS
jgi:hypothetical protein